MAYPRQNPADAAGERATHLREVGAEGSVVAAELTAARMHYGVDLLDVAENLRIRYDHLRALEEGRFDDLPGPTYVVGFLRSYAAYLGLDAEEMVLRFKAEVAGFGAQQKLHFPSPADEGRMPTGALLLTALLIAGGAYAGWYYVTNADRTAVNAIPEVPAQLAETVPADTNADTEVGTPEGGAAATDVAEEPSPAPAESPTASSATSEIAAVETAAPETADTPVEPEAVAVENKTVENEPAENRPVETETVIASRERAVPAGDEAPVDTVSTEIVSPVLPTLPPSTAESAPAEAPVGPADADESAGAPAEPAVEADGVSEPAEASETPPVPPTAESATIEPATAESISADAEGPATDIGEGAEPAATIENASPAADTTRTAAVAPVVPPPVAESPTYVPRVFGQAHVNSRIQVRARQEAWFQVTGVDNELLITRILRPGDVYNVPDKPGLKLMTGNAGGLEITVDGVVVPALGPVGDVLRDVALDPAKLRAGDR